MIIVWMVALGAVEAIVYLWRVRSANRPDKMSNALSGLCSIVMRTLGISGIASAAVRNDAMGVAAIVAYIASVTVANSIAHGLMTKGESNGK